MPRGGEFQFQAGEGGEGGEKIGVRATPLESRQEQDCGTRLYSRFYVETADHSHPLAHMNCCVWGYILLTFIFFIAWCWVAVTKVADRPSRKEEARYTPWGYTVYGTTGWGDGLWNACSGRFCSCPDIFIFSMIWSPLHNFTSSFSTRSGTQDCALGRP